MRKYYVGLDVHKVSIAIAVLNAHGKLITRTVIETSTEAVGVMMRKACLLILGLCLLLATFPKRSSAILRPKPLSADTPLATKFDEYGFISLAKEKRRLDRFARELKRKVAATSQVLVYGQNQADVDARIRRIRNYLVKKRGINPYRVLPEGQACRREYKTELWIVPPGATAPALADGTKLSPCKARKSAHGVTRVMNAGRA